MTLALVLAVGLLVAFGAAVGEAQTSGGPGLSLEPSSGRQGTSVTATVSGFDDCVGFGDDVNPPAALILWDGDRLGDGAELDDGEGEAVFTVPTAASFGEHDVVARCDADSELEAEDTFVVEPPVVVPAVVPNVVDRTREDATVELAEAGLVLGVVTGDGEVVRDQRPRAGTEVEPGTAVDLDLGVVPVRVRVPDLGGRAVDEVAGLLDAAELTLGGVSGEGDIVVRQSPLAGSEVTVGSPVDIVRGTVPPGTDVEVPDLTDLALDDVPAVLTARGLVLGVVRGDGDVVRDQEPAPRTLVPAGSAVNVSIESDVDPVVLVAVPDLGGLTADGARDEVEAVGLVLGGGLEGDARVVAQEPAAGTLVPLGSVVTVSPETVPVVDDDGTDDEVGAWLALLATVAAALLAAWLVRRVLRSRRDRRWVRRHVRVERGPTTTGGPVVLEDGDRPTRALRLEPHLDSDTPTLEEVAP